MQLLHVEYSKSPFTTSAYYQLIRRMSGLRGGGRESRKWWVQFHWPAIIVCRKVFIWRSNSSGFSHLSLSNFYRHFTNLAPQLLAEITTKYKQNNLLYHTLLYFIIAGCAYPGDTTSQYFEVVNTTCANSIKSKKEIESKPSSCSLTGQTYLWLGQQWKTAVFNSNVEIWVDARGFPTLQVRHIAHSDPMWLS